MVYGQTPYNKR